MDERLEIAISSTTAILIDKNLLIVTDDTAIPHRRVPGAPGRAVALVACGAGPSSLTLRACMEGKGGGGEER
jgi:hypothetical protein